MGAKVIDKTNMTKMTPGNLAHGAIQVGFILGAVVGALIATAIFMAASGSIVAIVPFIAALVICYGYAALARITKHITMDSIEQ